MTIALQERSLGGIKTPSSTQRLDMAVTNQDALVQLARARGMTWYHNFQLPDGETIAGRKNGNASVVRRAFTGLDLTGRNCVDLGTMDGLYAILMKQMGARKVLAFDRMNRDRYIHIVRELYGHDFGYYPGLHFENVPEICLTQFKALADFVNFAGILYHMLDPMRGIGLVRAMVRRGGMVLLDVPAIVSEESTLYFNHDWKFYTHGTYFVPTVFLLEKMVQLMGFEIVDGNFARQGHLNKKPLVRIALMLRAGNFPLIHGEETPAWVRDYTLADFAEFLDLGELWTQDDAQMPYRLLDGGYGEVGGSLLEYVATSPETPFNEADLWLTPTLEGA